MNRWKNVYDHYQSEWIMGENHKEWRVQLQEWHLQSPDKPREILVIDNGMPQSNEKYIEEIKKCLKEKRSIISIKAMVKSDGALGLFFVAEGDDEIVEMLQQAWLKDFNDSDWYPIFRPEGIITIYNQWIVTI